MSKLLWQEYGYAVWMEGGGYTVEKIIQVPKVWYIKTSRHYVYMSVHISMYMYMCVCIYVPMYTFLQILQQIESSSLCYTVDPCWLSILYPVVHT